MTSEIGYMIPALFFFFVFLYSLAWVYEDANAHGKTGSLWLLIVWFTWPVGMLVYYLLRNKPVQL
jgi:hypothetical protein